MTAEPKPTKDTIYIDVDDEITAIIDKVEVAKNKIAALVLPKRSTALQSIVNMRLLKRSADKAGKNIVLITSEAALMPLAGAAGIHVAKNLQSQPEIPPSPVGPPAIAKDENPDTVIDSKDAKLDYHRSIGELASGEGSDEPEEIAIGDDEEDKPKTSAKKTPPPPKDKKLKIPNFERFRLMVMLAIAAFIFLIVVLPLAVFAWPKATITLQTESLPVSINFSLTATDKVKDLDVANHKIPAQLKTSDQTVSQQVPATGQQNNGDKATGTIVISGGSCGPSVPDNIPKGTAATSNSLVFITQNTASFSPVVSGGHCTFQSNSIDIVAQNGGAKYNGLSNFTVSGYSASATKQSSGGTDNNVQIVSQADVDGAKDKASSGSNADDFTNKFKQQLNDAGFYLLGSTLKPSDSNVTASPDVGQPSSNATVTIKTTYSVLVMSRSDLQKMISAELNKQIDKSKQKVSNADPLKGATVAVESQPSNTSAELQVTEDTTAVPILDADSIKKQVAGQKTGDIKTSLSNLPGVKNVDVKFSPFYVSKAPKKPGKIHLVFKEVKSNSSP